MWTLWIFLLFWANLEDIRALENQNINEFTGNQEITQLVEDQIQNYLQEVKRTLGLVSGQNKKKRSADFSVGKVYGAEVLTGFQELFIIPSKFPNDILLFTTSKTEDRISWFAVALEADNENPQTSLANRLVLYNFDTAAWTELYSVTVNGGISLASLNIKDNIYIVVAEHYAGTSGHQIEGSNVYMFNETNNSLQYVQLLNTKYASHVIMWERSDMDEVFVAVATSQNNNSGESRYSTQSIVYHWLGSHFDIVDYLPTNNPRSIVQFNIGSFMFLAVANYQDNYGNTNIDSEIFRYDLNSGKFSIYQRLRTNAAVDIKYFCFESPYTTESFLIVANNFEKDEDGNKNYEADSIIYKLSDEEYFIPFQSIKLYAVKKWIPIVHNMGETGAFVLLAVCENGVVAFQYDGWRFVKSNVQYSRSWFGDGVSSIRSFHHDNQTVFTLANKKNPGNGANIFNAIFVHDSRMDIFYQGMEDWCEKTFTEVKNSGIDEMVNIAEHAPKKDAEEIVLHSNLEFTDVELNSVKTDSWLTEYDNVVDYMTSKLNRINLQLVKTQYDLEVVESTLESTFVSSKTIIDNFDIEKAVINCPNSCNFSELNIGTLNGEDMVDIIRNTIKDEGSLKFDELVEFKNLALLEPLETDVVNGHSIDSLIDWSQENYLKYGLTVNGRVTLQSELFVTGPIDDVIIDEKSVLILNPDQPLGSLDVQSVKTESLNLQGSLNGWNVGPNLAMQSRTQFINELNASELILKDRLLNGVDLGNLNLMALKTEAKEQIITGNHFYNRMEADDVIVSGMIYQVVPPGEYQPDSRGAYSVNGDSSENPNGVYMLGKPVTETVGVTVSSGRNAKNLVHDILSTSTDHTEEPSSESMSTSSKNFLPDSLRVDTNVRESVPESIKSAAAEVGVDLFSRDGVEYIEIIHEDSIFQGNLKINGTVIIVNGSLTAEDLISPKHNISSKLILEKGLRLDETNIPVHMIFDTSLNISKVNVETINNIKMESLVPTNASSKITITGHKTFANGLKLGGNYEVTGLVNNVNVSELVSNTLQCTGDQKITGSMLIGSLHTTRITSQTVYLNNTKWENTTVFKNGAIQLDFVSVEGDVNVDALTVQGKVSDKDIEYMLQDTLYVNSESTTVTGFKNFTNHLSVNKLETSSVQGLDMDILTQAVDKNNIWNTSELVLDYPIKVDLLVYRGNLDGIDSSEFGEWLMTEGDQEVMGQQTVRSIQAIGGIVANTINNVQVDRLLTETLRIDVNETMDHVIFNKNIKSVGAVLVDGKVQGLDISKEAVLLESPQLQLIAAHKTLLSPLTVNGSLQLKGNVAGFDLNEFCLRMMDNSTKLIINNGSAMFETEPLVNKSVNGYLLNELLENAWFVNENVTLNYPPEFTHLQFQNTTLQGEINNIKLEELSTMYLSKTLNQTWEGDVHFPGGITVKNSLVTPSAIVGNFVSGIKIEQFKESVLLDGEIQVIDGVLDFGNVGINGSFSTTGFVNDLDFLQDVMRLDVPVNFVKGHKLISKVEVLELDMPPRGKVQNVDIIEWKKSAVNTYGDFIIKGEKSFNGPFHSVSNMRVDGVVNGVPFDTTYIMHNSFQQTVTGRKVFDETSRVYVQDLESSGFLNSINMTDFLTKQMYTDSNITINGSKTFSKALEANKVIFTDNNNLTKMELQLKTPLPYNAFNRQINKLSSISASVQESLQDNRIYLRNYSRHVDLEGTVLEAMPVKNVDHVTLLAVTRPYDVTRGTLSFMKWNPTHNSFNITGNKILYLNKHPTSLRSINMRDGQRGLIIESEIDSDKDKSDVVESFLFLSNYTLSPFHRFSVPSRSLILHFEDQKTKCYIIGNTKRHHCQVYCYTARRTLHMRPPFECSNMTQSSVLTTKRATYVATTQLNKTATLHKWNHKTKRFNHLMSINLLNPVSVDTVTHDNRNYIAIANQHLVGNTTDESVDIYRLNEKSKDMVLIQQIFIVTPSKVEFAILPSSELVLYVLSENRATPFLIFLYRGIAGFEHIYTEATLPLITSMASVTDEEKRHFVILTNKVKGMILQAHFS